MELTYFTRVLKLTDPNDGVEKNFLISYNWLIRQITFTCRDDTTIRGEFKVTERPFASREPADFLLTNEVSNYLDHTPEERVQYYA